MIEKSVELAAVHKESALLGQTAAPDAEADIDLHFVCFVVKEGCLYELDGRNACPINHGACGDLGLGAAEVVKKLMAMDPTEVNFTVLALAGQSVE